MSDDNQNQNPEIVKEIYGQKIVGHEKDLANLKEKIEKCYTRGDKDFIKDVEDILIDVIQKDENRERIKKYAKEAAKEVLTDENEKEKDNTFKWKSIWIPAIFGFGGVLIGLIINKIWK